MKIQNKKIEVGEKLQNARKSCGLTQEEVCNKIECAPRYIGQLETNLTKSSIPVIIELCSLYGLSMDNLYSDYLKNIHTNEDFSKIVGYFHLDPEYKAIIENNIEFLNKLQNEKKSKK